MNMKQILEQARKGRPDLAAMNAGVQGRIRLAAYVARFPHSSGAFFTARECVRIAQRAARMKFYA
jgi:hypothetical protein